MAFRIAVTNEFGSSTRPHAGHSGDNKENETVTAPTPKKPSPSQSRRQDAQRQPVEHHARGFSELEETGFTVVVDDVSLFDFSPKSQKN